VVCGWTRAGGSMLRPAGPLLDLGERAEGGEKWACKTPRRSLASPALHRYGALRHAGFRLCRERELGR
jgi:hypothetical protein